MNLELCVWPGGHQLASDLLHRPLKAAGVGAVIPASSLATCFTGRRRRQGSLPPTRAQDLVDLPEEPAGVPASGPVGHPLVFFDRGCKVFARSAEPVLEA